MAPTGNKSSRKTSSAVKKPQALSKLHHKRLVSASAWSPTKLLSNGKIPLTRKTSQQSPPLAGIRGKKPPPLGPGWMMGAERTTHIETGEEGGRGDSDDDSEQVRTRTFLAVLGARPPERWNLGATPSDHEWMEIEDAFHTEIQNGPLDELLRHCFTPYEIHLISPDSPSSETLKNLRENNTKRYRYILGERFAGYPSNLRVKLTMLFFGFPVAPLNMANVVDAEGIGDYEDRYAPYPNDIPDLGQDMNKARVPLQFLSGHHERLYGRKDPDEPSGDVLLPPVGNIPGLSLRGGGGHCEDENREDDSKSVSAASSASDSKVEVIGIRGGGDGNGSSDKDKISVGEERTDTRPNLRGGGADSGQIPSFQYQNDPASPPRSNLGGDPAAGPSTFSPFTNYGNDIPMCGAEDAAGSGPSGEPAASGGPQPKAPKATPSNVGGPACMNQADLHARLREISYWHAPTIFHNNMTPHMPINAPAIDPVLKTGGASVPSVSVAVQTPTEQFRAQRAVHALRNLALDRSRKCPFDECYAEFNVADEVSLCEHIQDQHFPARCPFCPEPLYRFWNKAQRDAHLLAKHYEDMRRERNKHVRVAIQERLMRVGRGGGASTSGRASNTNVGSAEERGPSEGDWSSTLGMVDAAAMGTGAAYRDSEDGGSSTATATTKWLRTSVRGGGRAYVTCGSAPAGADVGAGLNSSSSSLCPANRSAFCPGVNGGAPPFFCHRCGSDRFILRDEMEWHVRHCANDDPDALQICEGCCEPVLKDKGHSCPAAGAIPVGSLTCGLCGYTSKNRDQRQMHMLKCRGLGGKPWTFCPCCGVKIEAASAKEINKHQTDSDCFRRLERWRVRCADDNDDFLIASSRNIPGPGPSLVSIPNELRGMSGEEYHRRVTSQLGKMPTQELDRCPICFDQWIFRSGAADGAASPPPEKRLRLEYHGQVKHLDMHLKKGIQVIQHLTPFDKANGEAVMIMRLRAAFLSGAANTINTTTTAAAVTVDSTSDNTFHDPAGNRLYTREDMETIAKLAKSGAESELKRVARQTRNMLEEARIAYEKRAANLISQLKAQLSEKGVEVLVNIQENEQETATDAGGRRDVEMADGSPEDEDGAAAKAHARKKKNAERRTGGSEGIEGRETTMSRSRTQRGGKSVQ